jgi:hypothetical protein
VTMPLELEEVVASFHLLESARAFDELPWDRMSCPDDLVSLPEWSRCEGGCSPTSGKAKGRVRW